MSFVLGAILAGCAHPRAPAAADALLLDPTDPGAGEVRDLVAVVHGTREHPDLRGEVRLLARGDTVEVQAAFAGLPPGPHGMHVHLHGDCSDPANRSAGVHLDFAAIEEPARVAPVGSGAAPVGDGPDTPAPAYITGDLGDLDADTDGRARHQATVLRLDPLDLDHVNGRAVVVHEHPSDPAHAPDGAAGTPIACGVLGVFGDFPHRDIGAEMSGADTTDSTILGPRDQLETPPTPKPRFPEPIPGRR